MSAIETTVSTIEDALIFFILTILQSFWGKISRKVRVRQIHMEGLLH